MKTNSSTVNTEARGKPFQKMRQFLNLQRLAKRLDLAEIASLEFEQAVIRVVILAVVITYLIITPYGKMEAVPIWVASAHLAFGIGVLLSFRAVKVGSHAR